MDLFQEARWTFSESDRVEYFQTISFAVWPRGVQFPNFRILRFLCLPKTFQQQRYYMCPW
jgi:hypothetical protein